MKLAGKIMIAAAVVGGIAAGVVAAIKTEKGKQLTGKVADVARAGVDKAKDGVNRVKDKFTKKPADDVVAETTGEEICEEVCEEVFEDDLPEIAPEEVATEEVAVDEEA